VGRSLFLSRSLSIFHYKLSLNFPSFSPFLFLKRPPTRQCSTNVFFLICWLKYSCPVVCLDAVVLVLCVSDSFKMLQNTWRYWHPTHESVLLLFLSLKHKHTNPIQKTWELTSPRTCVKFLLKSTIADMQQMFGNSNTLYSNTIQ